MDDTTANEVVELLSATTSTIGRVKDNNVSQAELSAVGGSVATDFDRKTAVACKLNDFAVCQKGVAVVTDTLGTMPTLTQLRSLPVGITAAGANGMSGWFRDVRLYKTRLSDAELQALTTP